MTAMGLSLIVYSFAVEPFVADIAQKFSGLPAFVSGMLGWFGIDKAITIILSAYGVKWASSRIGGLSRRAGGMAGA
jgi:hypothetical protein